MNARTLIAAGLLLPALIACGRPAEPPAASSSSSAARSSAAVVINNPTTIAKPQPTAIVKPKNDTKPAPKNDTKPAPQPDNNTKPAPEPISDAEAMKHTLDAYLAGRGVGRYDAVPPYTIDGSDFARIDVRVPGDPDQYFAFLQQNGNTWDVRAYGTAADFALHLGRLEQLGVPRELYARFAQPPSDEQLVLQAVRDSLGGGGDDTLQLYGIDGDYARVQINNQMAGWGVFFLRRDQGAWTVISHEPPVTYSLDGGAELARLGVPRSLYMDFAPPQPKPIPLDDATAIQQALEAEARAAGNPNPNFTSQIVATDGDFARVNVLPNQPGDIGIVFLKRDGNGGWQVVMHNGMGLGPADTYRSLGIPESLWSDLAIPQGNDAAALTDAQVHGALDAFLRSQAQDPKAVAFTSAIDATDGGYLRAHIGMDSGAALIAFLRNDGGNLTVLLIEDAGRPSSAESYNAHGIPASLWTTNA